MIRSRTVGLHALSLEGVLTLCLDVSYSPMSNMCAGVINFCISATGLALSGAFY
jgi:hypothetical protein